MSLKSQIESLLLVSNHPLTFKKLAQLTAGEQESIKKSVEELIKDYDREDKGINILADESQVQFITNAENSKLISKFIKEEITGELTRAQLETLTVIAYRGPITKPELEQIRGVNCAIILRNLLIRGLINEERNKKKMQNFYTISFDFMRHLGITELKQLPDYEKLNNDENLKNFLKQG